MSELGIVVTDAGIQEVINAEHSGTAPVLLTHVGFGTGQYTPTADQTSLQSEFKRLGTITGGNVGDNIIHIIVNDTSSDSYSVSEIGVFTASGTLFAVYSQATPIIQKAAASEIMLAVDIVLTHVDPDSVTIGDTNFILPPATTSQQGIVELATDAETQAGTDTTRAVTPASLASLVATEVLRGLVELATTAEATAGTDTARAVTPAGLAAAILAKVPKSIGSGTKPVYTDANGKVTASASSVGSATKPIYMENGELKASGATVGGAAKPIYSNGGNLVACSSTVGSATRPVYMSGGAITQCSYTLEKSVPANAVFTDSSIAAKGSASQPVYISAANTATACTMAAYNTAGLVRQTAQNLAAAQAGYVEFNSGFKIQWGKNTKGTSVTFPKAFTNVPSVTGNVIGTNSKAYAVEIENPSKTGFKGVQFDSNSQIAWIAVGR